MMEMMGKQEASSNGFVALDIESLSLLAAASASQRDSFAGTQNTFKKTFSKKGSLRGGERKTADSVTTTTANDKEILSVLIHVASEGDATVLPAERTLAVPVAGVGGRNRRIAGRRQGLQLDPRRVVVLFATMSSMGTLILLYFTLSLGKMSAGNTNAL